MITALELSSREYIAYEILQPLIEDNYRKRANRLLPDEWFWGDRLLMEWGMIDMPCYRSGFNLYIK